MNKSNEQRQIKFRAWDTRSKKMSDSFSLFGEFLLIGGVHTWQEEGAPGDCLSRLNDLVVMQFTGLLDKNGKEIYEGDLIKSRRFYFEVRWVNACFHMVNRSMISGPRHYSMTQKQVAGMEVIGNIYSSEPIVK